MHNKDENDLHKLGAKTELSYPSQAIPKPTPKDNPNVPPESRDGKLSTHHKGGGSCRWRLKQHTARLERLRAE